MGSGPLAAEESGLAVRLLGRFLRAGAGVNLAVETVKSEKDGGAVPVPDYQDINVSDKVVKIIQSYTGVVNRMVWRKEI
jgi:hypothetical protein